MTEKRLSHLDDQGRARMVDVSEKAETRRVAVARGQVRMQHETLRLIRAGDLPKGDVLGTARIAGVMAAKETGRLIPLCHPLSLTQVDVEFRFNESLPGVEIQAAAQTVGRTGVEMEALTAAAVAALTIYDMAKAVDKAMVIGEIRLVEKRGGKSGTFRRDGEEHWPQDSG